MKLISLNIGEPQAFVYKGKNIRTSIFKYPVTGERKVSFLNIEGDKQADLKVHGGPFKAVYSYDIAYYQKWKAILKRNDWEYGLFGENLTTEGLTDDEVYIGNVYEAGSVLIQAIEPRFPCFKLNIRFNTKDMLQQFLEQKMYGTYFSVLKEGKIKAGDHIKLIQEPKHKISIQQLAEAYFNKGEDSELARQIAEIEILPEKMKRTFRNFIKNKGW